MCIVSRLYKERLSQVDAKLQEVIAGKAPEYLEPLAALQENMQIRTKVAGRYIKWIFQQYDVALHLNINFIIYYYIYFKIATGVCFKVRNTVKILFKSNWIGFFPLYLPDNIMVKIWLICVSLNICLSVVSTKFLN